jgi:hypothetical protein
LYRDSIETMDFRNRLIKLYKQRTVIANFIKTTIKK